MNKIFLIILLLFGFINAEDIATEEKLRILTQPESSEIISIQKEKGETLATFSNITLMKGESGFIVRDLEPYQVIVGSIEVIDVQGTNTIGKINYNQKLEQPYLPTPRLTAKEGDKVIFRNYNNKAFIIAPNEETYKKIVEQYPYFSFINSDLLMGFLNSRGKHDPTDKTLMAACSEYAAGLVFIAGSKNLAIFSCGNMKILEKYPFNPINAQNFQAPFFTRIKFDGGGSLTYLFASKKSKQYYQYYDNMIDDFIESKIANDK